MRQVLVMVRDSPVGAVSLRGLSAYIEAEPIQERVADGLVVTFGVVMREEPGVSLLNPFATVQFQLLDQQGYPLPLPTRPSGNRIHTPGGDWQFVPPLPIAGEFQNGQTVEAGTLDRQVLTWRASEDLAVSYSIDRLLPETVHSPGTTEHPATTKLRDGVYRVRCVATLIRAEEPHESRILQSPAIEIRFAARR